MSGARFMDDALCEMCWDDWHGAGNEAKPMPICRHREDSRADQKGSDTQAERDANYRAPTANDKPGGAESAEGLPLPLNQIMQLNPGNCVTISEGYFCLLHRREGDNIITGESVNVDLNNLRNVLRAQGLRIVGEADWAVLEARVKELEGTLENARRLTSTSSQYARAEAAEAENLELTTELESVRAGSEARRNDLMAAEAEVARLKLELQGLATQKQRERT